MNEAKSSISELSLSRTPLFEQAVALKAKMTDFAGWQMSMQFAGINQEHQAVRSSAGIFDISHMGKFAFQGKNLLKHLQTLVPSDLGRLKPGQAQYTVLLNADGGIIDDIIFYYQGENRAGEQLGMMIVNAATLQKDKTWLLAHLESVYLEMKEEPPLQDLSLDKVLLAVQGPKAVEFLQPFVEADLSSVPYFGHLQAPVLGQVSFLARTGYTGEDGFELMLDPAIGIQLWQSLTQAGVVPCGLGARDTLRLEAAMALYGQDIDETTTPLEAGLGWVVHLENTGDFIGRPVLEAQKKQGVQRRLVGLQMQGRHIARHGYRILHAGKVIAEVSSGGPAPTLGYPIALAYVPMELGKAGQELDVEIRGKTYPATVVKKPFYRSPNKLKMANG